MSIKSVGAGMDLAETQSCFENAIEAIAWINVPNARALVLGTPYQASDVTKASLCVVNLTSTAALTLSGGQTHTAEIVIGATSAVASGTGTVVARYRNSQTGGVVVGVALNAELTCPCAFYLPKGWFFAVRQISGTVSIFSAFDQSIG
jgi:hypothetical protein